MILMDELLNLPDSAYLSRVIFRLGAAALLGGLIGAEREYLGKSAGLRTHMTVALGCASFILIAIESTTDNGDLSRAIQGVAAGIGFIGAGAILKRTDKEDIQGLTTAATLWLTAAVGVAAGSGQIWLGLIAVICAFVILTIMAGVGRWLHRKGPAPDHAGQA
jgi:putative Mg2+ transporter-C (MgtC) family protein